ncbi:MAG: PAS domain S-box protein [Nitrospirae bacterium]|nr:MAG: PAS domain S-box protein [Nitrospirota bacterium]
MNERVTPESEPMEQMLASERAFRRTLLDSLRIGVCQVDTQGQIVSLNLEAVRIFGRTEDTCRGQSLHALIGCAIGDDSAQERCPIPWVVRTGRSLWSPNALIRRSTGETCWVEFHCCFLPDPSRPGALFLFRDLSSQLQLIGDHQHLASMPEASPTPIIEVDAEGDIVYANPATIRLLDAVGYSESGLPKILPPTIADIAKDCLAHQTDSSGLSVIVEGIHIEWTFTPVIEKGLIRGFGLDLTKHMRERETLIEVQSRFHSLVNSAHEGIVSADLHGSIRTWNPAAESMFGYSANEVLGQPITILLDEPFREIYRDRLERFSFGEETSLPLVVEVVGKRKDGMTFPLELTLTSWKVGLDTHYGCFLRDLTDRKRDEHSVVAEKEHLATAVHSLADALIATDTEGRITLFNPMAERLTGWSQAEALHRPLQEIVRISPITPPSNGEHPFAHMLTLRVMTTTDIPSMLLAKDGTKRIVTYREAPIRTYQGQLLGSVLVIRDWTDQQRTMDELNRLNRLNSLSVLAGGIAHDFNNLLTTILGNLFVAKLRMVPQDPISQCLVHAEEACLRAKELTHQLLTFAKGRTPMKTRISTGEFVRRNTVFALSGSSTSCEFQLAADLWDIEGDEDQLKQVIHNLVINARQAMPQEGLITIRGENVIVDEANHAQFPTLLPGHYVKLEFEDRGPGIPEEDLPKVFDPYFTTKPDASGLGLATAYSIVQRHGGCLTVRSQLGVGTTFSLYIPAATTPPERPSEIPPSLPQRSGRILVMDDEYSIRTMMQDALAQLGYDVTCVQHGQEAITVYTQAKREGRPFTAVILDLTVPGAMGGKDAIQHLRAVDPQVKAIVTSGYADHDVVEQYRHYGFDAVLVKPYQVTELYRILDVLLASESPQQRSP